jgi:ribonuclease HI
MQSHITIFTDGASSGNPGPGGWGTLVRYADQITELGGAEPKTTNNRMELKAVLEGLRFVVEHSLNTQPITLYTDSSYVANGATTWIKGWKMRGWTNKLGDSIANVDLWKDMGDVLSDVNVKFVNVSGHSGIPGNERCDEIATGFSKNVQVHLYNGPYSQYDHDLENITVNPELKSSKDRAKQTAFSYLSLVDGVLKIHSSWNDCKARVEGKKGARYKKTISKIDEDTIRRSWGV